MGQGKLPPSLIGGAGVNVGGFSDEMAPKLKKIVWKDLLFDEEVVLLQKIP